VGVEVEGTAVTTNDETVQKLGTSVTISMSSTLSSLTDDTVMVSVDSDRD